MTVSCFRKFFLFGKRMANLKPTWIMMEFQLGFNKAALLYLK